MNFGVLLLIGRKRGECDPVWSKNSCGAAIELEPDSQSLVTLNDLAALFGFVASVRKKQLVAFTLMVAFAESGESRSRSSGPPSTLPSDRRISATQATPST